MKTAILAVLMFSPLGIWAQQYLPPVEGQPPLFGWHLENVALSQPALVTPLPAPDFEGADGTTYLQVLAPTDSKIGCVGIAIIQPRQGDAAPIKVAQVWPGSLAEAAGIKPNWYIISVDGVNVVGMSTGLVLSHTFGTIGTLVTLDLAAPTMSQTNRITIKRESVKFPYLELQPFIYKKPDMFDSPPHEFQEPSAADACGACYAVNVPSRRWPTA